jgi:hypothetical protein
MKQIYMYETLLLIGDVLGEKAVSDLLKSGRSKVVNPNIRYLVIE